MALPPTLTTDAYNNPIAALAQLLKGSQRVDPFAENRKFAADLIAKQTATPVGSEGEGWARLGQSAVGGLAQLGNAYFKRQWDQGSRAEMADIMGEKDETKRIEKLKNAQYIDPEVMAPIFANILAGRTERDQRTGIANTAPSIYAPGGAPPGAAPPGVPPSAVPPGGAWPVNPDIYGSGTEPPPDPGAVPPPPAPAPPAPPPPGSSAAATSVAPTLSAQAAILQGMQMAGPGTGPQVVEAPTATPVVPQGDNVQTPDMARTASLESSGNPSIVNPASGAAGLYQFMQGTAADLRTKYPELGLPNDNAASWTRAQQHAAKIRFDQDNAKVLAQNGMPVTPATLYLAHRAGATGASTLLRQNPNTPMDQVVPAAWIAQNPDMQGKTVGQFAEMAVQRFPGGIQGTADIPGNTAGAPPPDSPAPGQVPPSLLAQQILQGMQRAGPGEGDQVVEAPTATPVVPTQLAQAQAAGQPVPLQPAQLPPLPQRPPQAPQAPAVPPRPGAQPQPNDPGLPYHDAANRARAVGRHEEGARLDEEGFKATQAWRLHSANEQATQAAARVEAERKEKVAQDRWNYEHGITSAEKDVEAKAKLEAANRQRVDDLATSFTKNPDVVKYQVARPVMKSAIEAANTNSLAGDLNLIYAFATMMDPGSVVRDAETGMVRATASAGEQVLGLFEQIKGNSRFDPQTKANLLDQMHSRYTGYRDEYDRVGKHFAGRAERAGLNVEDIYMRSDPVPYTRGQRIEYGGAGSATPQPAVPAPPAVTTQEVLRPPPGSGPPPRRMIYRNGVLVPE